MLVTAKAVLLALSMIGVAATGMAAGAVDVPMQKAIDIHKDHLGQNSTMPDKSTDGQQNALDRLMQNRDRWIANPHNGSDDDEANDTDHDQNETDDDDLEDDDANETEDNHLDNANDNDQGETDDEEPEVDDDADVSQVSDGPHGNIVEKILHWMASVF